VQLSCELTDWHCAFVLHENDKNKLYSTKVNSSKSKKRGADSAKRVFSYKCRQLGHWAAAECPQKQQRAGNRGGKSDAKKNADAVLMHVIWASRAL
jgi:hypothetical protein